MTVKNSGGTRKGAGRPKGATTKRSREVTDNLASDGGKMPLEITLKWARYFDTEAELEKAKGAAADPKLVREMAGLACQYAGDTMVYMHPRLQSIAFSGNVQLTHEMALKEILDAKKQVAAQRKGATKA